MMKQKNLHYILNLFFTCKQFSREGKKKEEMWIRLSSKQLLVYEGPGHLNKFLRSKAG